MPDRRTSIRAYSCRNALIKHSHRSQDHAADLNPKELKDRATKDEEKPGTITLREYFEKNFTPEYLESGIRRSGHPVLRRRKKCYKVGALF